MESDIYSNKKQFASFILYNRKNKNTFWSVVSFIKDVPFSQKFGLVSLSPYLLDVPYTPYNSALMYTVLLLSPVGCRNAKSASLIYKSWRQSPTSLTQAQRMFYRYFIDKSCYEITDIVLRHHYSPPISRICKISLLQGVLHSSVNVDPLEYYTTDNPSYKPYIVKGRVNTHLPTLLHEADGAAIL